MKKFLKNIAYFVCIFLLVIFSSVFINKLLTKNTGFVNIDKNTTKLIVGASRSESALNDSIVHNALNLSDEAESLFFTKIKLRALLESNQHIDTVLLSLDSRTLDARKSSLWYNDYYLNVKISRLSHFISSDEWLAFFRMNSAATVKGITNSPKHTLKLLKVIMSKKGGVIQPNDGFIGGYYALNNILDIESAKDKISKENDHSYSLSSFEIENLADIIEYCKEQEVRVIFMNIPTHRMFRQSKSYKASEKIFDNFRKKNMPNEIYLDFSNDTYPDSNYADLLHLNKFGAANFSTKVNLVLNDPVLFEQYSK